MSNVNIQPEPGDNSSIKQAKICDPQPQPSERICDPQPETDSNQVQPDSGVNNDEIHIKRYSDVPLQPGEETVTVQAYDWQVRRREGDNDGSGIHAWCLNTKSESCLIRVPDFPVFCLLELPLYTGNRVNKWNKSLASEVYFKLRRVLKDDAPVNANFSYKKKLYYFRGRTFRDSEDLDENGNPKTKIKNEDQFPMLLLVFKTIDAQRHCLNLLKKPFIVEEVNERIGLNLSLWETDISIVRKMLTLRNTEYAQWFQVNAKQADDMNRISTIDNEYIVSNWKSLVPLPPEVTKTWSTSPKILVFDIETYSHNHKAFPNKYDVRHVAFNISVLTQRVGKPETRKRYNIVLGDCYTIKGATTIRVNNEVELIDEFCKVIVDYDPEVLSGYNIFGFDNPYLDARLKWYGKNWPSMGRIIGEQTTMRSFSWGSSGYGANDINYLLMNGRITVDMLPVIRRQFKLNKYDLNTVSNEFLKRGKHDVSAPYMFETHEKMSVATAVLNFCSEYNEPLSKTREYEPSRPSICKIDDSVLLHEISLYRKKQKDLTEEEFDKCFRYIPYIWRGSHWHRPVFKENFTDECILGILRYYDEVKIRMTKVCEYCIEDSALVLDIFEKKNQWITFIEMSSTMGVSVMELFTRGQQVRGLSQLYNAASVLGFVLDKRIIDKLDWTGGLVQPPIVGLHEDVMCWDFNSLYPNLIRRYNMCYTTLVREEYDHLIPDELCHVFEWDEDVEITKEDDDGDEVVEGVKTEHHRFKFVKKEIREGILPKLCAHFINERNRVRKVLMKDPNNKNDPVIMSVLQQRQLALKVSANSIFGMTGAQNGGKRPIPEVAMCITYAGRYNIMKAANYVEEKYGGRLIYGDTDSIMMQLPPELVQGGLATNEWGERLEREFSQHVFEMPLYMEYEKGGRILCIAKKKYAYWCYDKNGDFNLKHIDLLDENGNKVYDENGDTVQTLKYDEFGEPEPKIMTKGIILARRDNCLYQRSLYWKLLVLIMRKYDIQTAIDFIVRYVVKLVRDEVDWPQLSIVKGLGSNYKSDTYFMKLFAEQLSRIGKPAAPGERLDYIVVNPKDPEEEKYLGWKMRLPETYLERMGTDEQENIDAMYYIDKVLKNCIEQLFRVGYREILDIREPRMEQEDWYRAMCQIAKRGYHDLVRNAYEQCNGIWKDAYALFKSWRVPRMIGHVDKARTQNITGKKVLDVRINEQPIKSMIKAINCGSLKDIVESYASKELYEELYPNGIDIPNKVEGQKIVDDLNIVKDIPLSNKLLPPMKPFTIRMLPVQNVQNDISQTVQPTPQNVHQTILNTFTAPRSGGIRIKLNNERKSGFRIKINRT